jgi:hypothetical protein
MLDEHAAFAREYRERIVRVMDGGVVRRATWHVALSLVESWTAFRAVRRVKRWRDRRAASGA